MGETSEALIKVHAICKDFDIGHIMSYEVRSDGTDEMEGVDELEGIAELDDVVEQVVLTMW